MQHIYLIPSFLASVGDHWATLVSSVLSFALALWFAHRGKAAGFRALAVFSLVCLFLSAYLAWEDQYKKNIGTAFFSFKDLHPENATDESIDVRITIRNETEKPIEIEEIDIVRIWAIDRTPMLTEALQKNWCKEVTVSPRVARSQRQLTRWAIANTDAWYEYLNKSKVLIDGTERPSEAMIIEPNKGHIYTLTAKGIVVDKKDYNGAILCPVITYNAENKRRGMVCPGGGTFISEAPERIQSFWESTRWVLHELKPDEQCGALHLL